MKKEFSKKWSASKQPRKQRKYLAKAPLHIKRKTLSATLDKKLREKYKVRNIKLRKEDEVRIMRGKFKGREGKVSLVDTKNSRIQVAGVQALKKSGEKRNIWIHASNVKIISLNDADSKRFKRWRIKPEVKKQEQKTEKPEEQKPKTEEQKTAEKTPEKKQAEKPKQEKKKEVKKSNSTKQKQKKNAPKKTKSA